MRSRKHFKGIACASAAAVLAMPLCQFGSVFLANAASGICINEVCAKNTTYQAPDGGCYDWIEIYNPTGGNVDISGYGLSDKESKPYRFTFPEGTSIGAGQRIMVSCDSLIPEIGGALTADFGLSTSGETLTLTAPDGTLVDTITFGNIAADVSYGRVPDGSDNFAYLRTSPNAPNEKGSLIDVDVAEPIFSQEGGFYNNGFDLTITAPANTKVYYTLDGSVPTVNSTPFTSPIKIEDISSQPNNLSARTDIKPSSVTAPYEPVDKAMIVNAIAVDNDGNVSDVVTAAYFIGYGNKGSYYNNVKVLSLTTDADNLFDETKGIYVLGDVYNEWKKTNGGGFGTQEWEIPANYTQKGREWERPATIQVYENGQLTHSQGIGIRIHGGASRSAIQKSFNVYTRADYGASKFEYDLFGGELRSEANGKKIKEFDSFVLRNAGNDAMAARFRDKLNQGMVTDRDMLVQGMTPCILFINGEFWGHYEITEKLSAEYIESHYKVDKKNVCLIKNNELEEGDAEDLNEWKELYEWIKRTDLSQAANYKELCSKIDMQSFADYMATEVYIGNKDFSPNNTAMWKAITPTDENEWSDGKWRFILFDTEYGTGLYGSMFGSDASTDSLSTYMRSDSIYGALLKGALQNEDFKELFTKTILDITNENYNHTKVSAVIDQLSAEYKDMVVATLDRFNPIKTASTTDPDPAGPGAGGPGGWGGIGGWGGGNWGGTQQSNESTFTSEVNAISNFYRDRAQNILNHVKNNCGLKGNTVQVTINNDASQGRVKVNTTFPTFTNGQWTGTYFTDYPISLAGYPNEGIGFAGWQTADGKMINSATADIELTGQTTITAKYGESQVLKGDVNADGTVSIADLVMLSKWLLRSSGTLTNSQNADVCSDGVIDAFDLVALRKIVKG